MILHFFSFSLGRLVGCWWYYVGSSLYGLKLHLEFIIIIIITDAFRSFFNGYFGWKFLVLLCLYETMYVSRSRILFYLAYLLWIYIMFNLEEKKNETKWTYDKKICLSSSIINYIGLPFVFFHSFIPSLSNKTP